MLTLEKTEQADKQTDKRTDRPKFYIFRYDAANVIMYTEKNNSFFFTYSSWHLCKRDRHDDCVVAAAADRILSER